MLGHQVGVHFDMRKLVGMSLEMNLEIAFGGEPIKKIEPFLTQFYKNMVYNS